MIVTLCLTALAADAPPLHSRIDHVTVFAGSALVTRTAEVGAIDGELVLAGLPPSIDPESVRVRARGAEVVAFELRARTVAAAPNQRVEALRLRLRELQRERSAAQDEAKVNDQAEAHWRRLLALDGDASIADAKAGRVDADASRTFVAAATAELVAVRAKARELAWKLEDLATAIADLEHELGGLGQHPSVDVRDLAIGLVDDGDVGATLEIDYVVHQAGWRPVYDLRAARDARTVELGYRAQVWQQSGEDWSDVALVLSTAQPQRGAQGPDPRPIWVRLIDPRRPATAARESSELASRSLSYGGSAQDAAAAPAFAVVEDHGLSARFVLARRESLPSRSQPNTVLVGRATLACAPEYVAAPALDPSVWLRGRATNTSEWTLLPGQASVYFGADLIGKATLGAVQPGEELTLHLGADPALTIERIQRKDQREGPGVFSRDAAHVEAWTIRVENHGAAAANADGSATVLVREALPRPTDDRVQVELGECKPEVSKADRWKQEHDELGIATWKLVAPAGGAAEIAYELEITYPDGMTIVRS